MRKIVIPRFGGLEVFRIETAPDPDPGPGQVRVRVLASGVNFADLMARQGLYQDAPPLPMVVGYEVAGVVDAVGPGVPPEMEGRQVAAMTRFGGYATSVVVDVDQVVALPSGLDAAHAASIPVTGLTVWMMLEEMRRVRAGDRVLVHSAGGGVGLMALDLLKWRGAYAIGTASASKHGMLRDRGYDELIDYRTVDFEAALRDKEPLDCVLDPVGGASWAKGLRLLRPGGMLICFGFSARSVGPRASWWASLSAIAAVPWLEFNPVPLMHGSKVVAGLNMGRLWHERDRLTGYLRRLMDLHEQGVVRPLVHAQVPFDEPGEAHRILQDRENVGKVVLVP